MKRQREADYEIIVRPTQLNRIAAMLDRGTMQSQEILDTCPILDQPAMLLFIRNWRAVAIRNFVGFTVSYELEYLLAAEVAPLHSERV